MKDNIKFQYSSPKLTEYVVSGRTHICTTSPNPGQSEEVVYEDWEL